MRLLVTEGQRGRLIGLDELLILNALSLDEDLTADHAGRLIQQPEAEALIALGRLADAGLVEVRGQREELMWRLSARAHRALGGKPGFEPREQEKRVAEFAEMHGRITRGEAAELCGLSPDQAYRLLTRLAEGGRLVRRGAKKGAWYEWRGQNNRARLSVREAMWKRRRKECSEPRLAGVYA